MIEEKIKFPGTVFLMDAEYLNFVVEDIKKHFTRILSRDLPDMDLDKFLTYLSLDAAIPAGQKEIMVIVVHNNDTKKILYCKPSDFKAELDNVAFRNNLGEFQITSVSPEGIVSRQELFLNLLEVVCESADVKKLILVPSENEYNTSSILKDCTKEIVIFGMNKPEHTENYAWEILAFPLMQALGIKGNEI